MKKVTTKVAPLSPIKISISMAFNALEKEYTVYRLNEEGKGSYEKITYKDTLNKEDKLYSPLSCDQKREILRILKRKSKNILILKSGIILVALLFLTTIFLSETSEARSFYIVLFFVLLSVLTLSYLRLSRSEPVKIYRQLIFCNLREKMLG